MLVLDKRLAKADIGDGDKIFPRFKEKLKILGKHVVQLENDG